MPQAPVVFRPVEHNAVDLAVYQSKFLDWERRSSVRTKPRPILGEAEHDPLPLYFPPESVPLVRHPLVRARGEDTTARILLRRLHLYLDFTAELELRAVNPICVSISRRRCGFELPPGMLEDAYKIYTDEAWHAQFSDDMQRQIVRSTGVAPVLPRTPAFMQRLDAVAASTDNDGKGLVPLFFTIVSETLISAILTDIPRDMRIHPGVRELVADHAADEAVHHAFFSRLLQCVWPQLSARQRRAIGPSIPEFIRAFLDPDYAALAGILLSVGLDADEAGQVLTQSFDEHELAREARHHARFTVGHLAGVGVLDDPGTRSAFEAAALLGASAGAEPLASLGASDPPGGSIAAPSGEVT
jgi:hypothetical protein